MFSSLLPNKSSLVLHSSTQKKKQTKSFSLPYIHESLYLHNIIVREHDNSNLIFTAHKQNGAVYDDMYECSWYVCNKHKNYSLSSSLFLLTNRHCISIKWRFLVGWSYHFLLSFLWNNFLSLLFCALTHIPRILCGGKLWIFCALTARENYARNLLYWRSGLSGAAASFAKIQFSFHP